MKVLVVAPHPDDEVLGCGGTMARHSVQGDRVYVLVVTRGIPEIFPPEEIERTRQELRRAHKMLGVTDTLFLDYPAPKLDTVPEYKLAEAISEVIHVLQPDILYIPHRGDIHVDHKAVYNAAMVASRPVDDMFIQRILCYETLSETEWGALSESSAFVPNVFIDITRFLNKKLEAMASYRSQLKNEPHPRSLRSIKALAYLRGGTVGVHAAEAFVLVREILPDSAP